MTTNIFLAVTGLSCIGAIVGVLPLIIFYYMKKIQNKDIAILIIIPTHVMHMINVILTIIGYIIMDTKQALGEWYFTLTAFCFLTLISVAFYLPINDSLQDRLSKLRGLLSFMFCSILWTTIILQITGNLDLVCYGLGNSKKALCYSFKMCYYFLLIVGYFVTITENYLFYSVQKALVQLRPIVPNKIVASGKGYTAQQVDRMQDSNKKRMGTQQDEINVQIIIVYCINSVGGLFSELA